MKFLFALFFIVMALAGYQVNADYKCSNAGPAVCGKDGKTYKNACWARKAKVGIKHKGECRKGGYFPGGK